MKMVSYSDHLEEWVRTKTMTEVAVDKQKALEEAAVDKQKTVADIVFKLLNRSLSAEGVHEVTGLAISIINNLQGQTNPFGDDGIGVVLQAESFSFRPSFR